MWPHITAYALNKKRFVIEKTVDGKRLNDFRILAVEGLQLGKGFCEYADHIEIFKCSILAKLKKLPLMNGTHKIWKLRNPNIKMDLTPLQLNRKRRKSEKDLTKPQIQYIKVVRKINVKFCPSFLKLEPLTWVLYQKITFLRNYLN